jgi:hypothetical protein
MTGCKGHISKKHKELENNIDKNGAEIKPENILDSEEEIEDAEHISTQLADSSNFCKNKKSKKKDKFMTYLEAKKSIIRSDNVYMCPYIHCEYSKPAYGFYNKKLCKQHIKRHFPEMFKFKCDYIGCNAKPYINEDELNVHKFNKHNITMEKTYVLDEFAQSCLLKVADYKNKTNVSCPVGYCRSKFSSIKNLNVHIKTMHNSIKKEYKCLLEINTIHDDKKYICGTIYDSLSSLKIHQKSKKHTDF